MDPATSELLKLGLPGIVILGLAWACITLWRRINDERKECANTIAALQESRFQNALEQTKKITEAMTNVTTAMNNHIETNRETQEMLRMIASEYQRRGNR